jgi:pyridoxine kinase
MQQVRVHGKALRGAMKHVISIQSHVVYGAAGNSAAVFPMQRLGLNVWPIHTVQFSNHTQYGHWTGLPTPIDQIGELVEGIGRLDGGSVLKSCNAVLSGYLGSPEQGAQVLSAVEQVRAANPEMVYLCDPVMGHPAKGCVVPQGAQEHWSGLGLANS